MPPVNAYDRIKVERALSAEEMWDTYYEETALQVYPARAVLFNQGELPQTVYFLEEGLIKLVRLDQTGQEIIVGLRRPGSFLGAASAILGKQLSESATTLTACEVRWMPAREFLSITKANIDFAWRVQQALSCDHYELMETAAQRRSVRAEQRLEWFLWQLVSMLNSDTSQKEIRLQLPITQEEIGALISSDATYVNKLLKKLKMNGVLRWEKGWLIITDPQKLYHEDI